MERDHASPQKSNNMRDAPRGRYDYIRLNAQVPLAARKYRGGKDCVVSTGSDLVLTKFADKRVLPRLNVLRFENDLATRLPFVENFKLNVGTGLALWDTADTITRESFAEGFEQVDFRTVTPIACGLVLKLAFNLHDLGL
jgi:hypothetical protein